MGRNRAKLVTIGLVHQYKFMGGLPRSGSTVIASVLYQNPDIHTEGLSGLGWLMLNAHNALNIDQIHASGRQQHAESIVSRLPEMYYENVSRPVIIDRSRAWPSGQMKQMMMHYFPNPKVLCTVRNREDVLKSFERLCEKNNVDFYSSPYYKGFQQAEDATRDAMRSGSDMFLFVDYDAFVEQPQKTLDTIYDFYDMPRFTHDFDNVVKSTGENDSYYGLKGMHDVRRKVERLSRP